MVAMCALLLLIFCHRSLRHQSIRLDAVLIEIEVPDSRSTFQKETRPCRSMGGLFNHLSVVISRSVSVHPW